MSDVDQFVQLPEGSGEPIRLCHRTDGDPGGRPIVLIAGLALDLTCWPPALVTALVAAGFYVIRFDNRDAGRSTHVSAKPPSTLRQALAITRATDYDLSDMAGDTAALLDALGLPSVDLVGMSMGGMIAQTVAAVHPDRVRTLTSIFSTTGNPKVGKTDLAMLVGMAKPSSKTVEVSVERHLGALERWSSPVFSFDPETEREWARTVWERGGGRAASAGAARQVSAMQKSGDRTVQVRTIMAPTLVIHGDIDPMVNPSGGDATAAAIPGSKRVTISGMRHNLAPGAMPQIAALIVELTKAQATSGEKVG